MNHHTLSPEICETAHYIYSKGLAPGKSGNISARSHDVIAITPSGVSLGYLKEEEIVFIDLDGNVLAGGENPSSELQLHLEVYQNREDVKGIVHTHSPYATGFALAGENIERLEGFGPKKTPFLKMVEYAPPGTTDLAVSVGKGLKEEDVVILKNHGVVATGKNLFEAGLLAEFVEETAKTQFIARTLAKKEL
ncbi:class II aldolase/adducin family protein [Methanobacterium ferruginis]|uniref:class II aldolase/adducin family protein n=1 Tax=Methanobacterium ferruginis TaxID=710191 RepID=UPI0025745B55|nr:class II aldolase/adducin family protein [Methanobacterium ferruginis]BDZ67261.1 class II aldolase [Methanobacterium ferruginis]